jgi:hypothetical protein
MTVWERVGLCVLDGIALWSSSCKVSPRSFPKVKEHRGSKDFCNLNNKRTYGHKLCGSQISGLCPFTQPQWSSSAKSKSRTNESCPGFGSERRLSHPGSAHQLRGAVFPSSSAFEGLQFLTHADSVGPSPGLGAGVPLIVRPGYDQKLLEGVEMINHVSPTTSLPLFDLLCLAS